MSVSGRFRLTSYCCDRRALFRTISRAGNRPCKIIKSRRKQYSYYYCSLVLEVFGSPTAMELLSCANFQTGSQSINRELDRREKSCNHSSERTLIRSLSTHQTKARKHTIRKTTSSIPLCSPLDSCDPNRKKYEYNHAVRNCPLVSP